MGLFQTPEPVEDHGHGLLAEFEDLVSSIRERVSHRTEVVRSRLAALEEEHGVLDDLDKRINAQH